MEKIDLDIIKECLKDHKYYTLSVCGHPDPQGDAYSKDRMTVSSMIGDFYNKKFILQPVRRVVMNMWSLNSEEKAVLQ